MELIDVNDALKLIDPNLVNDTRDRLLFTILLMTGDHAINVRKLRWEDIIDEKGEPKKKYLLEKRGQLVELPPIALENIKSHYKTAQELELATPKDWVFARRWGKESAKEGISRAGVVDRIFPKWCKILGIDRVITPKRLRDLHIGVFTKLYGVQVARQNFNVEKIKQVRESVIPMYDRMQYESY